ncbi:Clp protease ClpP [Stenotrophomonas maltophilia]|uniref:ClpP-like prohead protease/major capsid protein fusion protein n=1 Tax=Stenotrophomonas maltophilia TaxID=40324 RepID=UPI001075FDF9|nr:ClpP-like prohead protease/major capsid protein fusion protein [Stenotrophomonas maltophilia]TFZ46116.1 Clp protease ClpP [Stenotrophomonas maltophilia]
MRLNRMSRAVRLCIRADAGPSSLGLGFLQVRAEANVAHVYVYGTIGGSPWSDSVSVSELVEQIGQITAGTIHVHLNSVGGVVADGFAIYNALRGHGARKIVSVEGQAASIASLVLQAGDERRVYASSLVMVHAPHTFAGGNASDFRQFADTLDVHANAMLEAYARRADDRDEMERLLTDGVDHWYTGSKAVEAGLADVVADGEASARTALVPAAVVAISGYLQALTDQVPPVASQLRGHIARSLTPQVFASLPEVSQQAVIGHIEDTTMKQHYQTILAQAGSPSGATAVTPAAAPAPATVQAAADPVQAAIASLQARNADISAAAQPHMGNAAVREYVAGVLAAADPNVTADHVNRHILSLLGARGEPLNGRAGIPAGGDQRDLTRAAMANAIEARAGITAPTDGNQFRGMTLMEIARACVQGAGVETRGMDRMAIVGQAFTHSSSDFPMLLGDAARRALLQGYQEVEEAFGDFTRAVNVPDFKPTNLVGLGAFSNLDIVPEGGEYKQGTFGEQSQAMQIVTYGKLFTITRQAVINDDLGVFGDVPRKMGQAAKRTLAQAVFDLLLKNPVLADGKALFHADHGNLLPAALISTASVDAMQAAMALQKSPSGQVIQVPMKGLLTPITLRGAARTVRNAEYAVGGAPGSNEPNIVRDTFEVWGDGRLDQKDKKAWYGIANSAYVDGIVVGYLDGNETPYLEQHQGFTVDGVAWKVRLDAAPAIADYRGLYKNPGQAPNP